MMLSSQGDITKAFVEPRIREITLELLKIIRETENDDLTTVMQKIVCSYTEQLIPPSGVFSFSRSEPMVVLVLR